MMQLTIPFQPQRGKENQIIYDDNFDRFSDHCKLVYIELLKGRRLRTSDQNAIGTGDLRARIRDLIKAGVPIKKEKINGRFKEYFL